jgi:hypothetical protein
MVGDVVGDAVGDLVKHSFEFPGSHVLEQKIIRPADTSD